MRRVAKKSLLVKIGVVLCWRVQGRVLCGGKDRSLWSDCCQWYQLRANCCYILRKPKEGKFINGGRRLFIDVCVMVTVGRLLLIVGTQWRWLLHAQENRSKRMEGDEVCDVLIMVCGGGREWRAGVKFYVTPRRCCVLSGRPCELVNHVWCL